MFTSRGSADQAIITDMTALAAERGAAVAVALVSCDRGFATALRFCRGHGCPTVWISAVNTKRFVWPELLQAVYRWNSAFCSHAKEDRQSEPRCCSQRLPDAWSSERRPYNGARTGLVAEKAAADIS